MRKENQLLSRISKILGIGEEEKPELETKEEIVEAVAPQAEPEAAAPALEQNEALVAATAALAELAGKFEELSTKFEAATAALAAIEAEKADMIAQAVAAKAAARKEKVEAAIGTEKAAGLLLATNGLDDAAFDAVVSALTGSVEVEAKTDLFKEVGVTAEVDAAKVGEEESKEMKLLKAKYGKK